MTNFVFRTHAVAASILFVCASGCSSATQAPDGVATSAAKLSADPGWWSFPNGQCLTAVEEFYPATFGAYVPRAGAWWTGNCAPEGACHLWLDNIPDPSIWERVDNTGYNVPSKYDMLVYPPVTMYDEFGQVTHTNPYGHVASFDSVDSYGRFLVMDSNWNGDERRASYVHTTEPYYRAYGWYHLRQLGVPGLPNAGGGYGAGAGGWCPNDGLYCGGDYVTGDPTTLYQCANHDLQPVQTCDNGCVVQSDGINDNCL